MLVLGMSGDRRVATSFDLKICPGFDFREQIFAVDEVIRADSIQAARLTLGILGCVSG